MAAAEQDEPGRLARQGLTLLLAGQFEAALALYEQALRDPVAPDLRIGLHLVMLEQAGKPEAAARLRDLTLRRGGNIALKGVALESDRDAAIAEYEALIGRGQVNALMIDNFMQLLAGSGRSERIRQLCDPDRLLRQVRLEAAAPGLAGRIHRLLLRLEAEAPYRETAQSVRNQRQISPFATLDHPEIGELFELLGAEGRRYLADWAASDHPLAHLVPGDVRLQTWALISRGEGFNVPHVHHVGWATGVYYPAAPSAPGGDLCVGPPAGAEENRHGFPSAAIRPAAGLLVLMPSFYTHWTLPLAGSGVRTAVAFDLIRDG